MCESRSVDCALRVASFDLLPKVARRARAEGQLGVASAAANEVGFEHLGRKAAPNARRGQGVAFCSARGGGGRDRVGAQRRSAI